MISFHQALHKVIDGKYLTRKGWPDKAYIYLRNGMIACEKGELIGNFFPREEDIKATDWVTVKEDFFNH